MPAFPRGDSTQLTSQGGAYFLTIPTGQTATITLSQIGRVCKVINGSTTQAGGVTFTDPDRNWTWFNAQALAPNQVLDLNFPPSLGNIVIAFSAASSGPLTVTLI
jgi:hypothetical protein